MNKKQIGVGTEKTRFRMYKAKHQWVIAGATVITMAALGLIKPQATHAATTPAADEQATVSAAQAPAKAVTMKNVTRTIHYVDATGKTVAPDTVQTAHFTSNDDGKTWQQTDSQAGFAAVKAASVTGMTADQAQIAAATVKATDTNSSVTVHYAQNAAEKPAATAPTQATTDDTDATKTAPAKTETMTSAQAAPVTAKADTTTTAADSATKTATDTTAKDAGTANASQVTTATTDMTASATAKTADSATTAAAKTKTTAPTVSYKSLLDPTTTPAPTSCGTASMTVNGQTSIEEVYAGLTGNSTTKPVSGTQDKDKLSIVASNLVKGDKVTITLPNFKAIDSAPNLSGATKVQTTNAVTYTVTTDTLSSLGFDVQIHAAYWPAKPQLVYQDNATVAVNNNVTGQVAMKATYRLADFSNYSLYQGHDDINNSYSYAGSSKVPSDIQVGDDFVRWIDLGYETGLTVAEYNNLTITMPVPATYQLDTAATQQFNTATTHFNGNNDDDLASVWDVSQASVGAPVVFTLDKTASPATARIDRPLYLVGKFISGEGTQTASAPASVSGATVYGNIQGTFDTFKATIVGDPAVKYEVAAKPVTNYVGSTDVATYNVMNSSWLTLDVTKSMKQPVNMTFKVPANMIGTGLKVSSSSPADALYGLTATLTAYDANGAVLATADLNSLARDSSAVYTWMPDTDATIASFGVNFTSLPNTSYSQVKLAPILAVATTPNGSQTYTIPTTSEIGGTTANVPGYQVIVTDSHAITSAGPHLDGHDPKGPYQAGDALKAADGTAAFSFYPFDQWNLTTYNILDQPAIFFVPLMDHATFVSIKPFSDNATEVMLDGHRYLRIDIPAGYSVNKSLNPKYNTDTLVNHIQINMVANADVTPDTQIKMGDATQEPAFIGIKDDNIDANWWTSNGGRIWTFDQLRQAGFGDVATILENSGYTKAYLDGTGRNSALFNGKTFPITAPTELMLSTGVKADAEDTFVSGDDDTASFYPDALTGSIREYIYNGGANTNLDYHGLITLPKKADGDAYSLDLTGAIAVPAGVTVQYSTQKVTGIDGQALSATQLANFTDGSGITDWGSVKSILFTAPTVANKASVNVEFPVKVIDAPTAAATAKALVFNYTKAQDGTVLGAKTTDLNTRVAEAQRVITVKYQDAAGNALAGDRTIKADAGSVLTLKPMTITGYKPRLASQDYKVTEESPQTVIFTYDQTQMNVTVNFINVLTNADAKGKLTLQGFIGASLNLTGYTKIDGYTAMPGNATAYTVTTSQIQNINLYFTPETVPFTVNFVADADHSKVLATAQTFNNGIVGYQYPVTAATVAGYTPTKASDNLTLTPTQNSYTFYYKGNPQTLTIHYVDDKGKTLHEDSSVPTKTDAAYDLKATVDGVDILGYTRKTADAELKGTATLNAKGEVPAVTVVYTADAQNLTVHYVDVNGKTLHEDSSVPTTTDATYDLKPTVDGVDILGYTRKTTDEELKGTAKLNSEGKVPAVTVVYTADAQDLTVHYVDVNGKTLHEDSSVPTKTDAAYDLKTTVDGVDIPGYTRKTTDEELKGTAKLNSDGKVPAVTVVYTADAQNLTVHYVDDKGKTLHEDSSVPTATDADYDLKSTVDGVDIPGYTRKTTDAELQGKATLGTDGKLLVPAVTVVYTADAQNLTIHYVDLNGNRLHDDTTFPTTTDADYNLKSTVDGVTIPGYYQRQTTDDELKGTATVDAHGKLLVPEVTVKYKALTRTIHVHYVNNLTGEDLLPSSEITKNLGDAYTASAPAISGYSLMPGTVSLVMDVMAKDTADVTFVYDKDGQVVDDAATPATLTVHYVKAVTGAVLQQDKVTTGAQGAAFAETAPVLDGYTLAGPATVDGKYAGSAMDLTFNYLPLDEDSTSTLTVHYVDLDDGTEVKTETVSSGAQGTAFTATAPEIENYILYGNKQVDGTYIGNAMTLTFGYRKAGVLVDEPNTPSKLTVHYTNVVTGEPVQPDKVTTGDQSTAFTETAPAIADYRIQGDDSASGKYQGNAMDLTFSYLQDGKPVDETATPSTLTVHYINVNTGETIQADKVTTGAQGATFTETAPAIADYRIQGDDSASGKYQGNAMDLTFSYLQDGKPVDETATPSTLTVHYVNVNTGETIQADKVTTEAQGTAFTETAPTIPGYRIQGDDSATGTYQGNAMDLTFTYLEDGKTVDETATPTTLTVHYVNVNTGETIQADKVTTGAQGTAFTETAPTIAGYRIQGDDAATGTYQGNAMNLTFSYLQDGKTVDETATPTTLTVHYVNVYTGETIQADKVTTGTQGTGFTETAPVIAGYRIQGDVSATGTYEGNTMNLTFSYLPDGTVVDETATPTTLTVHYINVLTGETIQADKVTTGTQGTAFTETAPASAGYRIQGDVTETGTYQGNAMNLTFSYLPDGTVVDETAAPTTLTVHYINVLTGETIQADKVTRGAQGTDFTETAPTIAGYRIQGDATETGTYQGNAMNLTFSYLPDGKVVDETATPVTLTVHYVDILTGEAIQNDKITTGTRGTAFMETAPLINGYHLQGNATETGTYQGNAMDLTFSYLPDGKVADETSNTNLTVHYVDGATGKDVQPAETKTGEQETAFTEVAPAIEGYQLRGDKTITGTYTGNSMSLTFTYDVQTTLNGGGQPTTPDNGGQPTTPDGGGQPTTPDNGGQPTTPNNGGQPTTPDNGGQPTTPDGGGQPTTPDNGGQPVTPSDDTTTTPHRITLPQTDGDGTSTGTTISDDSSTSGSGATAATMTMSNITSGTTSGNSAQTTTQEAMTNQAGNPAGRHQLPDTGDHDARNLSGLGMIAVMLMSLLGLAGKRKHED